MAARRLRILRPPTVRFRARKPCLRLRLRCEGWYSVPRAANRTGSWNSGLGASVGRRNSVGGGCCARTRAAASTGRRGGRRRTASSEGGRRGMVQEKEKSVTRHAIESCLEKRPSPSAAPYRETCPPTPAPGLPPTSASSSSTFSARRTMSSAHRPRPSPSTTPRCSLRTRA